MLKQSQITANQSNELLAVNNGLYELLVDAVDDIETTFGHGEVSVEMATMLSEILKQMQYLSENHQQ